MVDKKTLAYARPVLAMQQEHAKTLGTAEQKAYFDGLRDMLEIITTKGYTVEPAAKAAQK